MSHKKTASNQKPKSHQKTPPKQANVNKTKAVRAQRSKWTWIIPLAVIVIGLLIGAVFLLNQDSSASAVQLPTSITVTNAAQLFEAGAFLLDVRSRDEWDEQHIEGAVLIPVEELPSRISEVPTDQDILIICRSGNRSAEARNILRSAGLSRTTSIRGGITAWMNAGLPVVSGP